MRGFRRFLLRLALALGLIFAFSLWCWLRGQLLGPRQEGAAAHKKSAGKVKIAPAAKDSPAEPIVWTILLSRMEFLRIIMRITPIAITAAGIDAETVIPTRSPR